MKLKPHMSEEEIREKQKASKNQTEIMHWQIILTIQTNPGIKRKQVAQVLGINETKVKRVSEEYNKEGKHWKEGKQHGGRRQARENLTLAEEAELLESVIKEAKAGRIITYHDIQSEAEKKTGHTVTKYYIYDLFKRHGWKKKAPRPKHPKKELTDEELKKN
jgi:transposase